MRTHAVRPTDFAGLRVLFIMAAEVEYGPHLRQRFTPLITGVGPIEAAMQTALALQSLELTRERPDLAVSLGSAGSRTLEQGAIYQVSSVSWRDMDASPLGFAPGVTPFVDHPPEIALATFITGLPCARLSSGANIVSGDAYDRIDADMVDMETFAVWRACDRFGVPLIGLRGISDGAEDLRRYTDWTAALPVIDLGLAEAVDRLEAALFENGLQSVAQPLSGRMPS
ncbi:MAG: 5'-methylthioadenosine/S-adenosylhomocysteine nucleosidase [Asticcacaulis sp.]